ncbi:hypothetical protein, partial [Methylorubrum sp. SB2]|uniref:hypothetical protein n=1 Tax=Methylorubrum subtropicum TaxID=3138812 RepID=UPI00313A8226
TGELSETSVQRHTLTARSLDRTRKDMNKPPAFLFLDINLSKSEEAYTRGVTSCCRRAIVPVARPDQPVFSDKSVAVPFTHRP